MKLKTYFLMTLFFVSYSALAQTYEVSGIVTNDYNDPLSAVSVSVKGTSLGTSSDLDGSYSLSVSNGDVLVYSFVGFNPKEVTMDGTSTVNVVLSSGVSLDEIVVGSRNANRTAVDTPVPVDVIDISELTTLGPQVIVNQILNYVAPSFASNTQTISDGTDHIDPASLRGLGPDQVLVLINGKRRHTTSLVNVNGTVGRGSVGTDLNSIPSAAISRIEVLRDGAAAQYGSDAIAGVLNIVLKKNTNELAVNVTSGANYSSKAESLKGGVDGETVNTSINYGIDLGENGGYINFTGDIETRQATNRMGSFEGMIFHGFNAIQREAASSGFNLEELTLENIQFYAQGVNYFSPQLQVGINNATSEAHTADRSIPIEVTSASTGSALEYSFSGNVDIRAGQLSGSTMIDFELLNIPTGVTKTIVLRLVSTSEEITITYTKICESNDIHLAIDFDSYPEETSWEITNSANTIVASGGPYPGETAFNASYTLPDGDYTFTIFDAWGDGICCSYGDGSFIVTKPVCLETLAQGGQFGTSTSITFSLP